MNLSATRLQPQAARAELLLLRLPSLEALVFSGAGLAVLMIGSWSPDPRLNLAGIPFDIFVLIAALLLATTGTMKRGTLLLVALALSPLLLTALTIIWSPLPAEGLNKWSTLVFSSFLAFVLFNTVVERHGTEALARSLVLYLSILLAAAFLYKLTAGFFVRSVPFLFNGAIVFARFMCIAALMSLFVFEGKQRRIAVTVFVLAIIWTESKGPILAALLALLGYSFYFATARQRINLALTLLALLLLLVGGFFALGFEQQDLGRLVFFFQLFSGDLGSITGSASYSSTGSRLEAWIKSVILIYQHPWGVGLGGWSETVELSYDIPYAHNLLLELWSETGLLLGTLAAIPFVLFLFARFSVFWFLSLTLLLAQLVSGDIGDARLLLTFCLLACFSNATTLPLRR